MESSLDRIQDWEDRTGGFLNIDTRTGDGDTSGAPF